MKRYMITYEEEKIEYKDRKKAERIHEINMV